MPVGPTELTSRLHGGGAVVAVGLDLEGVERLLRAARTAADPEEPWRLGLRPAAADRLGEEFVLASAVEQLRREGRLLVRRLPAESPVLTLVAGADWAAAPTGARAERYALLRDRSGSAGSADGPGTGVPDGGTSGRDDGGGRAEAPDARHDATEAAAGTDAGSPGRDDAPGSDVAALRGVARRRFAAGEPATLDPPARDALVESARETLSRGFAADLTGALEGADRLPRRGDLDVRTLVVTAGARRDLLFTDVRSWSGAVGVAPAEMYIGVKDALVDAGLIETIKEPTDVGRPPFRLRLTDADLRECPATDLVPALRRKLE